MDFEAYKIEFDKSFSKVDPKEFIKEMEDLGYEFDLIKTSVTEVPA